MLKKDDVPYMLAAAIGLAKGGEVDLAPAWVDERDARIIAGHIGAADIRVMTTCHCWQMQCPACGAWDFGTTMELHEVMRVWLEGGRLPAGALVGGVCMACEHITDPRGRDIDPDLLDALRFLARGYTRRMVACHG